MRVLRQLIALVLLTAGALVSGAAPPADPLAASFRNPPPSARPHTWWHWMNGNITAEGISADLEAMAEVGVGGAQIFNVGAGIEAGPVSYLGDDWRRLFRHAVSEAERLGIELTFHNCGGWSSSGGPWVKPEHAMQILTWTETQVRGPATFEAVLEQPETRLGHYRDIAVLAFPTPSAELIGLAERRPEITASAGRIDGALVTDGDPATFIVLPKPDANAPAWLQISFAEPYTARSLAIADGPARGSYQGRLQVSDDGQAWRDVREIAGPQRVAPGIPATMLFDPTSARFWRLLFTSADARANRIALAELNLHAGARLEGFSGKAGFTTVYDPAPSTGELPPSECVDAGRMVDLTDRLAADGRLRWDVPAGAWTILRLGHTPTGKNNHPAPAGGEGPEVDKMSREANEAFWSGGLDPLLADVGPLAGRSWKGVLIDSYEVGCNNWTPLLREEFARLRGYDLSGFLPALTGRVVGGLATTEKFLWDFRRALADLYHEHYWGYFAERCHALDMLLWTEPYGNGNFDNLTAGGRSDVPMSEFWVGSGTGFAGNSKQAASVAHTYGRRYVGAEAFTASDTQGKWQNYPYKLKAQGDFMYAAGVNRFVFHRYAHQPWMDRLPGMTMGPWGFHFERTVTWWNQGRAWLRYLARCQQMLQEGQFVADLLYFVGEGSPAQAEGLRAQAPPQGYDYDLCDTTILLQAEVRDGRIVLPSGMSYRVLLLPDRPYLTLPVLRRVEALAEAGAVILGPRPQGTPSLADGPDGDAQVAALADRLWGRDGAGTAVGRGRIVAGKPLAAVLAELGVAPDFRYASRGGTAAMAFMHRRYGADDGYFVACGSPQAEEVTLTFRQTGRQPEIWDPETGEIAPAAVWREVDGATEVSLAMEPADSLLVLFRRPVAAPGIAAVSVDGEPLYPVAGATAAEDNGASVRDSFTFWAWVRPTATVELAAEALSGVSFEGQNWVVFPPPGHELYGNEQFGSAGLSVGTNGVKVVEHSANYLPNVLVHAAEMRDWTHVAVVYREGVPSLYLNGRLARTGRRGPRTIHSGVGVRHQRGYARFDGQVAGLGQAPTALTDAAVAALAAEPRPRADAATGPPVVLRGEPGGGATARLFASGDYRIERPGVPAVDLRGAQVPEPTNLEGDWQVSFPPGWGAPAQVTFPGLVPWDEHFHPDIKHFSGTATYRRPFSLLAERLRDGGRVLLDLGEVRELAEVRVNGQDLGILWRPPFRVDLTGVVRAGANELEVRVTNLWPNRLIGDAALPPEQRRTFTTWDHWKATDALLPSGLIGPARLIWAVDRPIGPAR